MAVDATLAMVFSGLTGDTDYVAWGQVSGVWRQLGFHTPEEA